MLQSIRDYTQGWIAGVIISIIILTFALWGIHSYFGGSGDNNIVAEVNGTPITKHQLQATYERMQRQLQTQGNLSELLKSQNQAALKKRALQGLIEIEALKQSARKQGFYVSDLQVDGFLQNIPAFQVNGQFSVDRFQQVLASTGLAPGEFLDLIKTSLVIEQPKLGILSTAFVTPQETNQTIQLVNQERDIDYITIPKDYFLSQPITVTPAQIQAYYNANKKVFMLPEQVSVNYIELSTKNIAAQINPNEEVLKKFYNDNLSLFALPMRWQVADVQMLVPADSTESQLAQFEKEANELALKVKTTKDLSKLRSNGAVLDANKWVTLNEVPEAWRKALSELTAVNQVSAPIRTEKGFVLLKVVGLKQPEQQAYVNVKDKVKESYIRQQADEKFADMRDQLANVSYEHPDSLDATAKALNLSIQSSALFSREKSGSDLSQYPKIREAAFSNDVMNLQNNSDVIQVTPDQVYVIHIKDHIPEKLQSLADVSSQIQEKLKTKEVDERAEKLLAELKSKLQKGQDPQLLATANKLSWTKAGYTPRYTNKVDSAILDMAFRLPTTNLSAKHMEFATVRLANGYAIVALKAVRPGQIKPEEENVFSEQLQTSDGLLEYELYKRSQLTNAKIQAEM